MTYGQRLKEAMLLAGMGGPDGKDLLRGAHEKLAAVLGISSAAVGMVLSGKSKQFTVENHARAARFLRVDQFWLATGEGEPRPPSLSEQAIAFARRYDKLSERERAKFEAALVIASNGGAVEKAPTETSTKAPVQ